MFQNFACTDEKTITFIGDYYDHKGALYVASHYSLLVFHVGKTCVTIVTH